LGEGKEGADDNRVKLSAARFVEAARGFLVGQAFSIRTRRHHRIERVNNADDARDYWYFGALKAGGIAFAIEGLMVVENIEGRPFETGEHAQNGPAIFGMFFHQGIFVRVETTGLSENCVRDADFTDVVEERGHFEILKLGFLEAEFLTDAHAPFREASAVYSGVEVLEIEELIEGADDGIAERRRLFFKLLDAERLQRRRNLETFRGRWNLVIRHWSYQQNSRQVPEPDEEPELFTQAETAW
jgi:hypothetical protein